MDNSLTLAFISLASACPTSPRLFFPPSLPVTSNTLASVIVASTFSASLVAVLAFFTAVSTSLTLAEKSDSLLVSAVALFVSASALASSALALAVSAAARSVSADTLAISFRFLVPSLSMKLSSFSLSAALIAPALLDVAVSMDIFTAAPSIFS